MSGLDIGIDLGTTSIIIYLGNRGIVLSEPSVVAVDIRKDEVLAVGEKAFEMIGKTPSYIIAERPLKDGVISNHILTEYMIREYIRRICGTLMIKPRISICIPSSTTKVEADAVVDAAVKAGARKVYLVEEPIAAAIGAGIDIAEANGIFMVDIGGGTTDIAVISLSGIVSSRSVKCAGQTFDQAIIDYVRNEHKILIGERMAESIKIQIANAYEGNSNVKIDVKGRNLLRGLPEKLTLSQADIYPVIHEHAMTIIGAIKEILEETPPELVGDIYTNGIVMTGGGSLLGGLDKLIEKEIGVKVVIAEDPQNCVAIGAGKSFDYLDVLNQGFSDAILHTH
ncbi:MAG: rod shape-determining protein [Oscillospiraceae bacterium]|jgi:rod shape-determining protein MreB